MVTGNNSDKLCVNISSHKPCNSRFYMEKGVIGIDCDN